jgi:hypothetical protein
MEDIVSISASGETSTYCTLAREIMEKLVSSNGHDRFTHILFLTSCHMLFWTQNINPLYIMSGEEAGRDVVDRY